MLFYVQVLETLGESNVEIEKLKSSKLTQRVKLSGWEARGRGDNVNSELVFLFNCELCLCHTTFSYDEAYNVEFWSFVIKDAYGSC